MTTERNTPRSDCAIANALDLVGDRWTLLICATCRSTPDSQLRWRTVGGSAK